MNISRRKAREAVLQALYWTESSGDPINQTLQTMSLRIGLTEEPAAFAKALGLATWDKREQMDRLIEGVSENWALDRIARIDLILLRMALTEMFAFDDIPMKVSMDEAIELAKRYSVEKSSKFINGILDALVKQEGLAETSTCSGTDR
jgi:N utilization substance protein B